MLFRSHEAEEEEKEAQRKVISDLLGGEAQLRSKKELIEKFIRENLPFIKESEEIPEAFEAFWNTEKTQALEQLCTEEQLNPEQLSKLLEDYLFSGRTPLSESVVAAMQVKPKLLERKTIVERIKERIMDLVATFEDAMGGM